jgi:hypothetical protein
VRRGVRGLGAQGGAEGVVGVAACRGAAAVGGGGEVAVGVVVEVADRCATGGRPGVRLAVTDLDVAAKRAAISPVVNPFAASEITSSLTPLILR